MFSIFSKVENSFLLCLIIEQKSEENRPNLYNLSEYFNENPLIKMTSVFKQFYLNLGI